MPSFRYIAAATVMATTVAFAPAVSAQSTLENVKKRGQLVCGVNGALPGFSFFNAVNEWEGLDVELCRAVAAAVLGDARKVEFVRTTAQERFEKLAAGAVDLLARNSTVTLQRTAGARVRHAAINFYDGQAFVVAKHRKIDLLASLRGGAVCITKGTTHEANMLAWFKSLELTVTPLPFNTQEAMYEGFFGNQCVAVTADATALASTLVRSGKAADYMMLPDIISKEPLGPFVRSDDLGWLDIVRWTHNTMIAAEEHELTRRNVDSKLQSNDPAVQALLGVVPGNGKALGLDEKWAYNIIKQVGNYSESYERNVGARSALGFARGVNALWTKGGLMYPLPQR